MLPVEVSVIAKILGQISDCQIKVLRAIVDSRNVLPGDLFFALSGLKNNGHDFLHQVSIKGAVLAVVDKTYKGPSFGLELIFVEDVLIAMQILAKEFLAINKPKIAAITGSVGKTTSKEFTATLLESKFCVYKTPGNANSQIGLPLSIINCPKESEILVLEMAMSKPGEIAALTAIAPPDVALITQIALVHAEHFDSIEEIAKAKCEIFCNKNTSRCIYNKDIPARNIVEEFVQPKSWTYSLEDKNATFFAEKVDSYVLVYEQGKEIFKAPWKIHGDHHIQNFLAAVAISRYFAVGPHEWSLQFDHLKLPPKRGHVEVKNGIVFINDSYNASEKSMIAGLNSLPKPKNGGRKVAVIGDMKEMGKYQKIVHKNIAIHSMKQANALFCIGDGCKIMHQLWTEQGKTSYFYQSKNLLIKDLKDFLKADDVVLLKGSRVHELETIIDAFDG
jgi:UDP-N-acetylmuramoyl-tripeptide--D-alanyl-D-alanine ligase